MGISWIAANHALDDDLHQMLARKDAETQMLMRLAGQFQDQKEAQQNAALREEQIASSREARAASLAQRQDAQKSLDEQRSAAATKSKADADAKTAETAQKAEHQKRLQTIVADPNADPEMKKAAQWELQGLKYKPADLESGSAKTPVFRIGRNGLVQQIGEAPKGAHFVNEPAPVQPPNLHFQLGTGPDGNLVMQGFDPKTGKVVNPNVSAAPPTADQRNRKTALDVVNPVFDEMEGLIKRINTHNGLMATAAGTAAKAAAKANLDADVAEYQSLLQTYAPVILRAHGLLRPQNEQIQAFIHEAAPQPTDSQEIALRKMSNLRNIGNEMAASYGVGKPPAKDVAPAAQPGGKKYEIVGVKPAGGGD